MEPSIFIGVVDSEEIADSTHWTDNKIGNFKLRIFHFCHTISFQVDAPSIAPIWIFTRK